MGKNSVKAAKANNAAIIAQEKALATEQAQQAQQGTLQGSMMHSGGSAYTNGFTAPTNAVEQVVATPSTAPVVTDEQPAPQAELTDKQVMEAHIEAIAQGVSPTQAVATKQPVVVQNGKHRQRAGSVGDQLWTLYDNFYGEHNVSPTVEQAKEMAGAKGLNLQSASIALVNWRKFNNIASQRSKVAVTEVEAMNRRQDDVIPTDNDVDAIFAMLGASKPAPQQQAAQ